MANVPLGAQRVSSDISPSDEAKPGQILISPRVLMVSAFGPKQTWPSALHMSAFGGKADMPIALRNGRL
jgi:hypothetical protein